MKKVISVMLAMLICVSLVATAFAAEGTGSITITNATIGNSYSLFHIFDATYSTDAEGFSAALELENIPLSGRVLILGCGGVSRTIATECLRRGCDVTLSARKKSMHKAFALRDEFKNRLNKNTSCIAIEDVCESYDLAVNGTPVGMYPDNGISSTTVL